MKIILASGSPRRKELLKRVVPEFEVMISGAEEELEEEIAKLPSIKESIKEMGNSL